MNRWKRVVCPRACLTSLRARLFGGIFRRSALLNLDIHKVCLRFRALTGEKSARKIRTRRDVKQALILITNLLFALAACAPSLYSKNEVLEILSEQYREDFVIIETLNSNLYSITPSNFSVKSKLYSEAPSSNPENIFWVRQDVIKHGGLFVTYENVVEDTLTFDCFLKCLDNFLQENQINSFFTIGNNEETELTEYLAEPHLQGGRIYVSITEKGASQILCKRKKQ